jgi:hypothetical protein
MERTFFVKHSPFDSSLSVDAEPGITAVSSGDDSQIVSRIAAAYRRSVATYDRSSMWWSFFDNKQRDLDKILNTGTDSEIANALCDAKKNYLLYGFENLFPEAYAETADRFAEATKRVRPIKDQLVQLAVALGVMHIENPEGGPWLENLQRPTDEIVALVEKQIGSSLAPQWYWDGLFGMVTRNGIVAHRMIHAAYCAMRVQQMTSGSVLEIGAGVGHIARYAMRGVRSYTICDLPIANAAQAYFLMRNLGEGAVALEGEAWRPGQIRILSPSHLEGDDRYDLVINVDGLTEYGQATAERYMTRIFHMSGALLSINHEVNSYTVNAIAHARHLRVQRFPYWMRRGYVEEIITR